MLSIARLLNRADAESGCSMERNTYGLATAIIHMRAMLFRTSRCRDCRSRSRDPC
jgi:hypothetical protein